MLNPSTKQRIIMFKNMKNRVNLDRKSFPIYTKHILSKRFNSIDQGKSALLIKVLQFTLLVIFIVRTSQIHHLL